MKLIYCYNEDFEYHHIYLLMNGHYKRCVLKKRVGPQYWRPNNNPLDWGKIHLYLPHESIEL